MASVIIQENKCEHIFNGLIYGYIKKEDNFNPKTL